MTDATKTHTVTTPLVTLEKSVGSRKSTQSIAVQDAQMQRLQEQKSVDAPGKSERTLIMLLCSCTRKIKCIHAQNQQGDYEFF